MTIEKAKLAGKLEVEIRMLQYEINSVRNAPEKPDVGGIILCLKNSFGDEERQELINTISDSLIKLIEVKLTAKQKELEAL